VPCSAELQKSLRNSCNILAGTMVATHVGPRAPPLPAALDRRRNRPVLHRARRQRASAGLRLLRGRARSTGDGQAAHKRRSAALVQRRSVLHDADAPVPSCTPADGSARLARGGSRHADTIDHYPADATAHTGLGGHTIGLMNRRDRHCLCGASERQPEQSNRYSSDHCFLPVVSE
jgi:hypothetical protein